MSVLFMRCQGMGGDAKKQQEKKGRDREKERERSERSGRQEMGRRKQFGWGWEEKEGKETRCEDGPELHFLQCRRGRAVASQNTSLATKQGSWPNNDKYTSKLSK